MSPSPQSRLAGWRLFLPPFAVFALAGAVFALVAFDLPMLVASAQGALAQRPQAINPFGETQTRLQWAGTVLLFYCALLAAMAYSGRRLCRSDAGARRTKPFLAGMGIALLLLGYLAYSSLTRNNFSYIFYFTFDLLTASQHYSAGELAAIRAVIFGLNILAALVPTLVLASGCCVLAQGGDDSSAKVEVLKDEMRELKRFTGLGSALMVAGVLHMFTWLSWPAVLVGGTPVAEEIAQFAEAMGLYWGVAFTLVIATFYIPTAARIHRRAEAVFLLQHESGKGPDLREWLRQHGLSISPTQQIPQLIALLAPLLAEPIASVLVKLSETQSLS